MKKEELIWRITLLLATLYVVYKRLDLIDKVGYSSVLILIMYII